MNQTVNINPLKTYGIWGGSALLHFIVNLNAKANHIKKQSPKKHFKIRKHTSSAKTKQYTRHLVVMFSLDVMDPCWRSSILKIDSITLQMHIDSELTQMKQTKVNYT